LVNSNELFTIGIASDQSPMLSRARHWHKFMGIMVPVHVGGEELSKEHNLIPVFIKVKRLKRGFYQGTFKVLSENPKQVPDYGITEMFLKEAEQTIIEAPEYYLWTHKRWKHRKKVPKEYQD
jgi:KDO2-lipid IV(A) lauroyltransferase